MNDGLTSEGAGPKYVSGTSALMEGGAGAVESNWKLPPSGHLTTIQFQMLYYISAIRPRKTNFLGKK